MIDISDMLPEFQTELLVVRAGIGKMIKGKYVKGKPTEFKIRGFCAPTVNNSSATEQGVYSFSHIDIYTKFMVRMALCTRNCIYCN